MLFSVYVLFTVVVLSSSFGVAATMTATGLLVVFGCIVFVRMGPLIAWPRMGVVWAGLSLCGWLVVRELISDGIESVPLLLWEYRFFWLAPLVAGALITAGIGREVWLPVLVGSVLYSIGSTQLTLLGDPLEIAQYRRHFQGVYAVPLSLGGKFVHGLWATMAIGCLLGWSVAQTQPGKRWILVATATAILLYTLLIEDGRTGYAMTLCVWFLGMLILCRESRMARVIFLVAAGVVVSLIVASDQFQHQIGTAVRNATAYFDAGRVGSSVGNRLQIWPLILSSDWIHLMFGHGYQGGTRLIQSWIDSKQLIGEPASSGNLHSDIGHLIVYGGCVAVLLYFAFAITLLRVWLSALRMRYWTVLGLAMGLVIAMYVSGLMNSTLLDLRERSIVLLAYILLLVSVSRAGGVSLESRSMR